MKNVHSSWSNLRKQLTGQDRITVSMNCQNGGQSISEKAHVPNQGSRLFMMHWGWLTIQAGQLKR